MTVSGFFGLTTKYSEGKINCLNHTDLLMNILLHVVNITSDHLNIHEKYTSNLNIQTSKKDQLHMKQRQTKLNKDYIRLNSQTGKKKIIIKNEKRRHDKKIEAKTKNRKNIRERICQNENKNKKENNMFTMWKNWSFKNALSFYETKNF